MHRCAIISIINVFRFPPQEQTIWMNRMLAIICDSVQSCNTFFFHLLWFLCVVVHMRVLSIWFMNVIIAVSRPKGQHSAPRGGPPRSWTNAELTEALHHVWNKKMTTSQASRLFGIPYNSLLMYVRGKYGKSLNLEQLRKGTLLWFQNWTIID